MGISKRSGNNHLCSHDYLEPLICSHALQIFQDISCLDFFYNCFLGMDVPLSPRVGHDWLNCTTVKWWGLCSAEPLDVFAYTNYYQKLRRADQPFYNRVKRPGVSTAIWERRGKDSDGRKEEQVSPTPWWDPSRRFPVSRRDSSCTGLDMTELPREFMKVLSSVIKKMGTKQVMK